MAPSSFQSIPKIRGTRLGIRDSQVIDQIKSAMLAGEFFFHEPRGQIGGVKDRHGVYYVVEGHHRMVAAMEIFKETGNPKPLLELLRWGLWTEVFRRPSDARPLPSRTWWGAFRNWLGI